MPVRMTGMISGMDTESLIKGMVDAQKLKNKRVEDKSTLLTWKQDKWKELNTKLYKLYTDHVSKMRLQGNYLTKKVTSSNENLVTVTGLPTAPEGSHTLTVDKLASSQYVTGGKITATSATKLSGATGLNIAEGTTINFINGTTTTTLTVTADTTIANVVSKAKEAGLNANYDENQGRFFISSKESGLANAFQITSSSTTELNKLGLDQLDAKGNKIGATTYSTVIAADDSQITYNKVALTSSSNVITVNGLTMTLKGTSAESVSLNVSNNTEATYNMIKDFVKNYNEILKEMNTLYDAPSTRGYNPLSDDEKSEMTDDQIEKWETKIKDSILRRDSALGPLRDAMRMSLMTSVDVNGKKYSLTSFGIQTSANYKEGGLLHIAGDKDDSIYGAMEDKLKKALEEDPDTVMKTLTGIVGNLYETMNDKMSAIPNFRSALTFYNDKEMAKVQTQYKKDIARLEGKLVAMEDKYYKQFAAMEKALATLQSQTNALTGMLGMNNNK